MLSSRQQHCLKGIGVTRWTTRRVNSDSADSAESTAALPVDTAPPTSARVEQSTIQPVTEETTTPVTVKNYPMEDWGQLHTSIEACQNCSLASSCTRKVPGKGSQNASLMIIGEAPGHEEDLKGKPFVGRAGQLLDKMLSSIGLGSDQVYITNILKCRPPNNRDPKPDEVSACRAFLNAQIQLVQPKILLSVGRVSALNLLQVESTLGRLRNQWHQLPDSDLPLLVTYHPAYLLRNPIEKQKSWEDLKTLQRKLQSSGA